MDIKKQTNLVGKDAPVDRELQHIEMLQKQRIYHKYDVQYPDNDELDFSLATVLLWLIMIAVIVFAVTRYLAT